MAGDDFAALLEPGYAYFNEEGQLIQLEDMATAKTVRVGKCTDHSKEYARHSQVLQGQLYSIQVQAFPARLW